jgi:hypothetical protein
MWSRVMLGDHRYTIDQKAGNRWVYLVLHRSFPPILRFSGHFAFLHLAQLLQDALKPLLGIHDFDRDLAV